MSSIYDQIPLWGSIYDQRRIPWGADSWFLESMVKMVQWDFSLITFHTIYFVRGGRPCAWNRRCRLRRPCAWNHCGRRSILYANHDRPDARLQVVGSHRPPSPSHRVSITRKSPFHLCNGHMMLCIQCQLRVTSPIAPCPF